MEEKESKYGYLNHLRTEQLEEILSADFDSQEDSDIDMILYITEVIERGEKEHPTGRLCDVDEAWKEFQEHYMDLEGPLYPMSGSAEAGEPEIDDPTDIFQKAPSKAEPAHTPAHRFHRTFLKRILPIAATIAVLLAGMITAQAAGLDVFGALGRWTDETFHFVSPQGRNMGKDPKEIDPNSQELHDALQAALDEGGIAEPLAPTWFPEGCAMDGEPKITSTKYIDKIYIEYQILQEEKYFAISIEQYSFGILPEISATEKDAGSVEQYLTNGRLFYIMTNNELLNAVWSDGQSLIVTISANIPSRDLKHILDSIGV